jgi:hypothetical protein
MNIAVEDARLKEIFKAALIEVLEERRDLVREVIEEALEDAGMVRAIEEGAKDDLVSEDEIFAVLKSAK